jgi:hypothetical protein
MASQDDWRQAQHEVEYRADAIAAAERRGKHSYSFETGLEEEATKCVAALYRRMGYKADARVMISREYYAGEEQTWEDSWGVEVSW